MPNSHSVKLTYKGVLLVSLVFMSFFTAPIFSYSPVRFSDLGALLIIFLGFKASAKISFGFLFKLWSAFLVVAIVNTALHFIFSSSFEPQNAFISLFRLIVGIASAVMVVNFSKNISLESLSSILVRFVTFHCSIVLIYAFVFYVLGFDYLFKIVTPGEERNRLITENHLFLNHFRVIIFSGFYYRLAGVFEEPAWFGWVMTLFCSFILQIQMKSKKKLVGVWFWGFVFFAYMFTVSISAIVGLLILAFVYLFLKHGVVKRTIILVMFPFLLTMMYFILPEVILNRVMLILGGGDGSTSHRVIGSINGALSSISINPLIGSGLGDSNRVLMYKRILDNGSVVGFQSSDGSLIMDMHNIFLSIFSSLGIPGGIIFAMIILVLIYFRLWVLLTGYFVVFMSVNVFDSYLFLTSWGLAYLLFVKRQKNIYA